MAPTTALTRKSNHHPMRPRLRRIEASPAGRQSGAYAVEYGLIFPVFFVIFYGVFAYGMITAMRLGLQHAAEEGARAALRYPADPGNQILGRVDNARGRAFDAVNWMRGFSGFSDPNTYIKVNICPLDPLDADGCVPAEGPPATDLACGIEFGATPPPCEIVVAVTYPYGTHPIFPSIPGFGLILPEVIQGRARLLIDGRAFQL